MDVEHGSEKKKSPEKSPEKIKSTEKMEEEDVATQKEMKEFPVVDWKTCVLTENFMYYQVFRGDGSSKNYKVLSEMLEDFDRRDVEELYRLVKEKYSASRLEGLAIHMLTEKKYPLSQELLSKMLSKKLEVDHESLQAFELLRLSVEAHWYNFISDSDSERACQWDFQKIIHCPLDRQVYNLHIMDVELLWIISL
ncbi:hypothetical protein Tco_0079600 [Tanacetum coccineum]